MKPYELLACAMLCLAGGYADAGSYVLIGSFAGHLTGNGVLAVVSLVEARWPALLSCAVAVLAFLLGTIAGTVWPHSEQRNVCGRLFAPLLAEILVIGAGMGWMLLDPGLDRNVPLVCVCFGLGLQNGTFGKIGSVAVHSTYMTGMSTSLITSVASGAPDVKRRVISLVLACFVVGAGCGAFLAFRYGWVGYAGVCLPLVLALLLAGLGSVANSQSPVVR